MTNPKLSEEATKSLIDETIRLMGDVDAAELPHLLRERLRGQIAGDLDVEGYLRELARQPRPKD